ncbi:diacylglycerol kinase [Tardiphaga sp.]|jgi:diacylglycerol kinase (ATP)|uniref:diacylglycerol kinase n=1 Tax=Tardiphaga sp. TaxID=1926292 RepID=UPI0037D9E900
MNRLWRATINSWNGLRSGFTSERAIREEVVALLLSLPLAVLIGSTMARRIEMVAVVMLVLTVELLNTAIEKLADRVTMEHDSQIGRVKDLGSAAVAIALLIAGMVWLFALGERVGLF